MQQATRVAPIVLHIPHASTWIPEDIRPALLLGDDALEDELLQLTDHFTDELFGGLIAGAAEITFPVSRLVVDPERFEEDEREPAGRHGMGVIYTRGSQGQVLRAPPTAEERRALLERFYHPHHRRLATAVRERLAACGTCLVLDCHSFPRTPLPTDRSDARPDICIGTDPFHTPPWLRDTAISAFESEGFSLIVDQPFTGAIVPAPWYGHDEGVSALMIEVGRWLYMDEARGEKRSDFNLVKASLQRALDRFQHPH
jgi:N-formylglutamate amidohydrolase